MPLLIQIKTNKHLHICIFKLAEAMAELCQSEAVHHFVVQTAIHHAEKSTHRKYLMSTMYRLAKSSKINFYKTL